jgi:serine/threonine-protein kinase
MNEQQDTVDVPSVPADALDVGLAAGFGRPANGPSSVLVGLRDSLGDLRPVLLKEAQGESAHVVKPKSDAMPPPEQTGDRYQLLGEIARGGMGAVLRGRDVDLGRDLAVKVLLEKYVDRPEVARRFIEEAQIGGQLQHPGVVPVYDVGRFGAQPFFTMKLVKGKTLAALLSERGIPVADASSAPADLPRFLDIALKVAQTIAYAHAKGVIHRDLKPANVMVGAFGEVQVMDWGLAKVLAEGGVADEERATRDHQEREDVTNIRTARSSGSAGSHGTDTEAGSLLGTPAYMPPEQANGDIAHLDRRADVFGLGAMMCEILTGKPPYVGRSVVEVRRKAANGDLADALARLDGCGADQELTLLTKVCLSPEAIDRPKDAQAVADALTGYLNGVQERAQAAERERAVAVARAIEERRRRKVQLALAAAVLALTTLGGLSTTYYLQQRHARAAAVARVVAQAETLRDQALAEPENVSRWQVALAAVEQAEAGADAMAQEQLLALRTEIAAGLAAAERDRALLERLVDIRSDEKDDPRGIATSAAYAAAFREAGIDLARLKPAEAGAMIQSHPPSVVLGLTGALDEWAAIRRGRRKKPAEAETLSAVARIADPDPWRNELRTALDEGDPEDRLTALQLLAGKTKFEELNPMSLQLLGSGLNAAGDRVLAESVLRRAQQRYPRDVWVNYELGNVLSGLSRPDEAIRFYTAARALRPETAHNLAHALEARGDWDEAIAVFCDLIRLRPKANQHLVCLSGALKVRGRSPDVVAVLAEAVAARREVVRLQPDDAEAHANLAVALVVQGQLDEAIAEFRMVQRLEARRWVVWEGYGIVRRDGLRTGLLHQDMPDGVISQLSDRQGNALRDQGKLDEAIALYREAIRVDPDCAEAYCDLGGTLARKGDYAGALEMYRKGHVRGSKMWWHWQSPSAQWVARAERELALAPRLPALLRGEDQPRDNDERLAFARMAKERQHYVVATRLWAEALAADPEWANDFEAAPRYHAACAAALTVATQGADAAHLDNHEQIRLWKQALGWLRAELAWRSHQLDGDAPIDPTAAREALQRWQEDRDLASLRDAAALTKLPAEERAAFTQLWADVAAIVKKAEEQERTQLLATAAASRDIAAGRTQDALVRLAALYAANPQDTTLLQKLAPLQAWFGQNQELLATCRQGLAWAKNMLEPEPAGRVALACCLLPPTEKAQLEAGLALARRAVQLGKDSHNLPWFQMALGMAEYRSGHWAKADAELLAATNIAQRDWRVPSTSALYRAMILFRQGNEQEARQLAIEAVSWMKPLPTDEKNPLAGNANHQDQILWLAYKEAKALIRFDAVPGFRVPPLSGAKAAPDIVGADIDGKTFRLSDYRGKVVLLDFFIDSCSDCRALYPHERRLVKKYANQPFVLLGINGEGKERTLQQLLANQTVTWRCWWDGKQHIHKEWQVDEWNTLYLIDHKGLIREMFRISALKGNEKVLEASIHALVEAAGKGP